MLHSLDYTVNIENKNKKSQNIISFRGVFASTGHIYNPLIEKYRDHLDFDLFLLTRWGMFPHHSLTVGDFVNSTVQVYESKKCDTYLSRARDNMRRIHHEMPRML